jgi:hypothetical protein
MRATDNFDAIRARQEELFPAPIRYCYHCPWSDSGVKCKHRSEEHCAGIYKMQEDYWGAKP